VAAAAQAAARSSASPVMSAEQGYKKNVAGIRSVCLLQMTAC
jgi:hypothetical protein